MTTLCCLRFLRVLILFTTVFPSLISSDTLQSFDDVDMNKLLTGHIQIRTDSVPNEVLPCLSQPALAAVECPFKHSQWNNMHCLNNSFGMFTNEKQFVNFGLEPLGVVFPSLLINPIPSRSACSAGSSALNEKDVQIESLLQANAEARMNITLTNQLLEKMQHERQQLEEDLRNAREANLRQREQMQILRIQAERLREIHQECITSDIAKRNASIIALRAAQDHITELKNQNKLLMEANSKCSSGFTSMHESLVTAQDQNQEYELELARCSANLTSTQESEMAVRKMLEEESDECSRNMKNHLAERETLISEKHDAQTAHAFCIASLKEANTVHEQIEGSYRKCQEDIGRKNVQFDLCSRSLNLCRGNHTFATNAGQICEQDRDLCLDEASRLKESLTLCENNLTASHVLLISLETSKHELAVRLASIQVNLDHAKLEAEDLRKDVEALGKNLEKERNSLSDAESRARVCSLDLITAQTSFQASQEKAGMLSGKLNDCKQKKLVISQEKITVVAELAGLTERNNHLRHDLDKCRGMLDETSLSEQNLGKTYDECQKHLSNVTSSLSVIEFQRNDCLKRHNFNIEKLDEWRRRYEKMNGEHTTINLQLVNCSGRLAVLTRKFKYLEGEADEMQILNVDLRDRLNTTLASISAMTNSNMQLRKTMSIQNEKKIELHKQLTGLEAALEAKKIKNKNCLDKSNKLDAKVATLELRVSQLTSTSAETQITLNRCSQQLNNSQAEQNRLNDLRVELEENLWSAENALRTTTSQYNFTMSELETLQLELNLCHGNHTESIDEALAWKQQLLRFQNQTAQERENTLRRMDQIEEQYNMCQRNLIRTTASLNATILDKEHCQEDNRTQAVSLRNLRRNFQVVFEERGRFANRINQLNFLIGKLRDDMKTYERRTETQKRQIENSREHLKNCREAKDSMHLHELQLEDDLEKCLRSKAKVSEAVVMPGLSWEPACPSSEQGSYLSVAEGCLLVTKEEGSWQKMKELCGKQAGGRLLTKDQLASGPMRAEINRLIKTNNLPSAILWLDKNDPNDVAYCPTLTIYSNGTFTEESNMCNHYMPRGLCFTEHQVQTEVSESWHNTSFTWETSHNTMGSSGSGGVNFTLPHGFDFDFM